jgi:hypothetical protein
MSGLIEDFRRKENPQTCKGIEFIGPGRKKGFTRLWLNLRDEKFSVIDT